MVGMTNTTPRVYDSILTRHLANNRQMAFVSGPRQVGKTTCCRSMANHYLNWDNQDDREIILAGPARIAESAGLDKLQTGMPVIHFDELHKYPRWKELLKGFFDVYADRAKIVLTGSSRMDIYRRGGDSMMGRYFLYRMHPFSVAEAITQELPDQDRVSRQPRRVDEATFDALWYHGGYPEPFLKRDQTFSRQWRSLALQQFAREDIREIAQIQHMDQLETLAQLLAAQSAQQLSYSGLAKQVRVSVDTIRRWITTLQEFHFGFRLRPWFRSVPRSLRKEPKWFLRDWAAIEDPGSRAETFVACHLLKAVDGWSNLGFGNFGLHYLRDKEKREVDFLVVRDERPWLLVEARHGDGGLSSALKRFQELLGVPYAMQVVLDADYVDADCFARQDSPLIVPARTFLSQLL